MRRTDSARLLLGAWTSGLLFFLFAPLIVVAIFSFNDSSISRFPLSGFTLEWYARLFANPGLRAAMGYSLVIALVTVTFSVSLGVLTAVGIHRLGGRLSGTFRAFALTPMMVPRLVIGIALLTFYNLVRADLSLATVIVGHVVMTMPYVVLIASARLAGLDRATEEAAWDLGAGSMAVFREITLPYLRPAIVAGALMAFTLSFDEVVVTFFTTGRENTLPMVLWSMLRFGLTPEVNAIATLTTVLSASFAIIAELSLSRVRQAQPVPNHRGGSP